MYTVPQVLSKSGEDVAAIAEELKAFGYQEININAGCPSGTVVSKGRGAGLLDDERALLHFLDEMFERRMQRFPLRQDLAWNIRMNLKAF